MKKFAAQYIITGSGDILKRGIVSCDDSGIIKEISDTEGDFRESAATPFYNGIIVPGFINCHSHLELSDMKGVCERGHGLGSFIADVREKRISSTEKPSKAIEQADRDLYRSGTAAIADICNTSLTFSTKDKSKVEYINLLEIFGIDPGKAGKRLDEILALKEEANRHKSPSYIVPHSVYSISRQLFEEVAKITSDNEICSIHFLESLQERELIDKLEGELLDSYQKLGIDRDMLASRVEGHLQVIRDYLPKKGKLMLVHNTFADRDIIMEIQRRKDVYWCLCPNSNLYIENSLPPVEELISNSARIVLGTDSLASNDSLNLLEEIKTLQLNFPGIGLAEMVSWATRNGAEALNLNNRLGTIEAGKAPGLVLLENCDLEKLRLKADSKSTRLI